MPLMCAHLCACKVPSLTQSEIAHAMDQFNIIDRTLRQQPMVSYLFCLEFILKRIGRGDMVPYINRIKCSKRRHKYNERLRLIFANSSRNVAHMLTQ